MVIITNLNQLSLMHFLAFDEYYVVKTTKKVTQFLFILLPMKDWSNKCIWGNKFKLVIFISQLLKYMHVLYILLLEMHAERLIYGRNKMMN